jgi:prepilin-type N-terminal cleavage/methylation domain-containing protein
MKNLASSKQKAVSSKGLDSCLLLLPPARYSGFTLIETMVAITIVTLSIAGPLYTASRAIVAAENARDQLIASYLAQEGIEYVRMMRDDEYLAAYQTGGAGVSSTAWNNFLNDQSPPDTFSILQCRAPKVCALDPVQGSGSPLASCTGNNCTAPLYLLVNGVYSQQNITGSTKTPFVRSVQATDISATDERIVSTVKWNFYSIPYSVTITDHLTPWQ